MKKTTTLLVILFLFAAGITNAQITLLTDWEGQTYTGLEVSYWSDDFTPDTVVNSITDGINASTTCLHYPAHTFASQWGDMGSFLIFKNIDPADFNKNTHIYFKYLAIQSSLTADETVSFQLKFEKGGDAEVTTSAVELLFTAGGTDEWKEMTLEIPTSMLPTDHPQVDIIAKTKSGGDLDFYYDDVALVDLTKYWHEDVFVDFGTNDVTNGNITVGPDANGNYWTNVVNVTAGAETVDFVDSDNNPSIGSLVITSDFGSNGINTGGLLAPDPALLGELAIATATQDYFYTSSSKGFRIDGLDPDSGYVFKMFASRETTTERITKYTFTGLTQSEGTLTTSGTAIGDGGYNGNNNTIYESDTIFPDQNGSIDIAVSVVTGGYAYINAMIVEQHKAIKPVFPAWVEDVYIDCGHNDGSNGNETASPDANGNYWNNFSTGNTGTRYFLKDKSNNQLNSSVNLAGYFSKNGINHGGLLDPDAGLLDDLAIATATQDYFYTDYTTQMDFEGLDATKGYVFKIFASRATETTRISKYTFTGANPGVGELQTSGAAIGDGGYNGNNNVIYVSDTIIPASDGTISIGLDIVEGGYAYINCMKVQQFDAPPPVLEIGFDGEITEGAEDGEQISVWLGYDGFAETLTAGNWTLSNLPEGVSIGSVTRTDAANAVITLSGNTTGDYDADINDIQLTIAADEFIVSTTALDAETGITFTAIIEPAVLTMNDDGEILEGAENGEVISVVLEQDEFVATLTAGNWTLSNLPAGVTIGTVTRTDATHAAIALSGNTTEDYDADINDIQLTVGADEFTQSTVAVVADDGVALTAVVEPAVLSMSDDGEIYERAEDGEVISVVLEQDEFVASLTAGNWTLSNLPAGVSIGSVSRTDATHAEITLSGNSTDDYDVDITDVSLTVTTAELVHSSTDLTASSGVTFTADLEIGISENRMSGMHIYPNPANEMVYITLDESHTGSVTISLTDIQGKMIWQSKTEGTTDLELPAYQFEAGIYILTIMTEGKTLNERVVIE